MSNSRLIKLQAILDRFICNHSNDIYIAFNPFFSLATPALFERENGIIIRDIYYGQSSNAVLLQSIVWLLRNLYSLFRVKLQSCMKVSRGVLNSRILHGKIERRTKILFVTWMNLRDFQSYSGECVDRFWGDLFKKCGQKGLDWQILVFPLYKISSGDITKCLRDHKVILCQNGIISLGNCLKIIYHGLKLIPGMFNNPYPKKWITLYIASLFNQRTSQALSLYLELKKMTDISSDLKVIIPWEAQPEQKAICKYFRENGNDVFCYIHSSFGDVPFQYVKTQFDDTFYPNKYYMHSEDTMTVLADLGYRRDSMKIVRPVRFKKRGAHTFSGKCYLPFSNNDALKYTHIVKQLVHEGLFNVREICLHPSARVSKEIIRYVEKFPYAETSDDIVVAGFSAVIFEALEAGCVVYQIVENGPGEILEEFYPSIKREKIYDKCFKLSLKPLHNNNLIAFDSTDTIDNYL